MCEYQAECFAQDASFGGQVGRHHSCSVGGSESRHHCNSVDCVVYLLRAMLLSITRLSELWQRNQGVSEGYQQLARMMVITFA
jgi:hypothetical protein